MSQMAEMPGQSLLRFTISVEHHKATDPQARGMSHVREVREGMVEPRTGLRDPGGTQMGS